jgi:UDP-glucose 4-epimerase
MYPDTNDRNAYSGRKVIVTGGLGFLGSNLVIRLVQLGADTTVVDPLITGCGGNPHNLAPVERDIRVIHSGIAAVSRLRRVIRGADIVFNLAGEISHSHSMRFPKRDALLNASSQLSFLEECARTAPGIRIVYAGTRQIYGTPRYLPVDEDHPVCPVDFNGIHKNTAGKYHLLYKQLGRLDTVNLILTNLYGPRVALSVPCQGFLTNFIRKSLLGLRLEVFGDGRQLRDPLYVDDAVNAFLAAGAAVCPASTMYNVGGPEPLEIGRIAEIISRIAGLEPCVFRPFPPEQRAIDIGSYYANYSRIRREMGWEPLVKFEEGIERTIAFYRSELRHYIDPAAGAPVCKLTELHARRPDLVLR